MAKKTTGLSSAKPKNEATPLGTSTKKRATSSKKSAAATTSNAVASNSTPENSVDNDQKVVDSNDGAAAHSSTSNTSSATTSDAPTQTVNAGDTPAPARTTEMEMIDITVTKSAKQRKSKSAVYELPEGFQRASIKITGAKNAPATLPLNVPADMFQKAKGKLSKEERAKLRKDAPKLTPAQKLAKLQERAAKLQAKLDAEAKAAADKAAGEQAAPAGQ
jgi:hypothetical protein